MGLLQLLFGDSHWKSECPVLMGGKASGKVKPRDGAKGSALAVSLASQHVDAKRPRVVTVMGLCR